jgi:hypothetical protein
MLIQGSNSFKVHLCLTPHQFKLMVDISMANKTGDDRSAGLDGRMHRLMQRLGPSPLSKKDQLGLQKEHITSRRVQVRQADCKQQGR